MFLMLRLLVRALRGSGSDVGRRHGRRDGALLVLATSTDNATGGLRPRGKPASDVPQEHRLVVLVEGLQMKSLKVELGDRAEVISFWTTTSSESLVLVPEFWQVAQSERWKHLLR